MPSGLLIGKRQSFLRQAQRPPESILPCLLTCRLQIGSRCPRVACMSEVLGMKCRIAAGEAFGASLMQRLALPFQERTVDPLLNKGVGEEITGPLGAHEVVSD